MKINTKVIFEWSSSLGRYEEVYCESYNYHGPIDKCQAIDDDAIDAAAAALGTDNDSGEGSTLDIASLVDTEGNAKGNVTTNAFPSASIMVAADEEIPR